MIKKSLLLIVLFASLHASDIVVKDLPCKVHSATRTLQNILKAKHFTIFAKINHAANARAVGLKMPPSMMLVFGKAKIGTQLIQQDPTVALDLPLRILIYEDRNGKTHIAYRDAKWLAKTHLLHAPKLIKKVNKGLEMITNRVITECVR